MAFSRDHILAEIRRTAVDGRALGRERFFAETGIRESDWIGRHWTRWSEAVAEAGCDVQTLNPRLPDDHLLRHLATLVRQLGHVPTTAELRLAASKDPGFPSHNTFRRFGSADARRHRLHRFCLETADFQDVAPICAPPVADLDVTIVDDTPDTPPADVGVVYLIRAGRHFKIGRTTSLDRRTRQLAIQLPERATVVHAIRTDDPAGIERYWHMRFAAQRLNGEWFALSAGDVSAFRRRKFM